MVSETIQRKGRRLLVEFTCGRCGKVDYMPYCGNPAYNVYINMCDVKVPNGWSDSSGYMPLLCDNCSRDYRQFMGLPEPVTDAEVPEHD